MCSTKDIDLTDEMVGVVEDFTIKRADREVKVDVNYLSKMSLSENHAILKACVNILMSSALTEEVPLHPIY